MLIGTSGWSYPHWRGTFYPANLPPTEFLALYATRLPSVEINSSFYHLPRTTTLQRWLDKTPPNFVFAMKASSYITHRRHLLDPQITLPPFLEAAKVLR
ncbi:MAG: DUF72 domain-containing protein, partial [Thermoleophilia bacterium]|nr:DUF72 domain-containing protein [Thermoleophilia bacterium]